MWNTYVTDARHDHSRHGGGVLLLHRDNLLMNSVDCEMYYMSGTSDVLYQETMILSINYIDNPVCLI